MSGLGLSLLTVGCERTISKTEETKVNSDGSVKTKEKTVNAFPYPPKKLTSQPTKKTADAVKILPILKQKPVAAERICVGKSAGI